MLTHLFQHFRWSILFTLIALVLAWFWTGWMGVFTVSILILLETSLSFDNAVVNAGILNKMDPIWQRRFLTWGMLIAVFGMRVLFPLAIVAIVASLNIWDVAQMALSDPDNYAQHLASSHIQVAAFGGMFLLMVFLSFLFDDDKEVHWFNRIEHWFSLAGKFNLIEVIIALVILTISASLLPESKELGAFLSGASGIASFAILSTISSYMEGGVDVVGTAGRAGLASFLYLEMLDASFSFDGVIGAFAITQDVVLITLGLGVGALFVRSMTIYLVRQGTLNEYRFLEHGAHYAIGALALIMLISMHVKVPEIITGLIGVLFISAGIWSSVRYNKRQH